MEVLQEAGIGTGMRVLDLGCGAGDFSLQARRAGGPPRGRSWALTVHPGQCKQARRRAAALKVNHLRFQAADLETIDLSLTFDALIGRFILMFLADPTGTLARMIGRLAPGGVVAFVETDLEVARSIPAVPRVETALEWIRETFRRGRDQAGPGVRCCGGSFRDAGLEEPRLVVRQKLHPAPCREGVRWVAELVRSLVPEMERLGVASAEEVGIETLEEELHQELLSREATLCTPLVVGACSRNSGILNQPNFFLQTSPFELASFELHPSHFKLQTSPERPLQEPVEADGADEDRTRQDHALAVPGFLSEPSHRGKGQQQDGNLTQFHPDVEGHQGRHEVVIRQAQFPQNIGKSQSVQQAECENHGRAPGLQLGGGQVLGGHVGDGEGNQRLYGP